MEDRQGVIGQEIDEARVVVAGLKSLGPCADQRNRLQPLSLAHHVRVDPTERLDFVTEIVQTDRPNCALVAMVINDRTGGWEEVEDPSAQGEVAGLLDRVLPRVAGTIQPIE